MTHDGHRARLREKAIKGACEKHEKLELLLFSALPRVNTNEIAHLLLDGCGGLVGVFSSDIKKLCAYKGMGRAAAISLRNVSDIMREHQLELCHPNEILRSEVERYKYLSAIFLGATREQLCAVFFSQSGCCLGYEIIAEGDCTRIDFPAKCISARASELGAHSVLLVHSRRIRHGLHSSP